MKKIQAMSVRVCVFTWTDWNTFSESTGDDRVAASAVVKAVETLAKKHAGGVPVEYGFCPLTIADNQLIVSQEGINPNDLPAIQIYADYPDGTGGYYWIKKGLVDKAGLTWTKDTVLPYLSALLYRTKGGPESMLCKVFPPLCAVPSWLWLAAAGFATFEAATGSGVRQIAYGAGAAMAWQEFFKRGGFDSLKQ